MIMVVLVVLVLLFMRCTTSLDFDQLLHESGGSVVTPWSNVSSAAAAKRQYYQCLDKEREALLHFKAGLVDDYGILLSWSSQELDCCKWWGVHCSRRTGHVIELHLSAQEFDYPKQLSGNISPSLLELHHLNYLDLSYNDFDFQPIPDFIGSLAKLKYLNLSNSGFDGTVPSQLGNLSNLNHLDLSYNMFNGTIPKFIGYLSKLKYLDLSECLFGGTIPPQLGNLSNLNHLDLSYNRFNGTIPKFIGYLSKLKYLDLSECLFGGSGTIPPQLGNLSNLNHLDLSYNMFNGTIPKFIGYLSKLKYLNLSGCRFRGTIPSQLGNLSNLNHLDLSYNMFNGTIPKFIGYLSKLKYLDLSSCEFKGTIPPQLGNLSNLNYLAIMGFDLETNLVEWLPHLTSLQHLDLSRVDLSKANDWADAVKSLCCLQFLHLSYTHITWNLEDFVNNLQAGCDVVTLVDLDASVNNLTGSLPDRIITFSSLRRLNLGYSKLNGTLSKNLGTLSKLEILDLSFNSLQGTLSKAHFFNLTNLYHLDLALNSLALNVHWIPPFRLKYLNLNSCRLGNNSLEWISRTQKTLSYLDLANCGISENIPATFWDPLNGLTFLNMSSNQIKGKVPDFPSYFGIHSYPRIDLSSNLFEGPIPIFPSNSKRLNLSRNKFSGTLSSLCQIVGKEIRILDISHNLVTGGLPDCLMQFTKLSVLDLAHNKLSLMIPASIGSLLQLETLNLYNNNFFGELPLSMKNCTSLRFLDLGANDFSGNVPSWIGENLRLVYALSLRSNKFAGVIPSQLCYLEKLQVLVLSMNNLSGRIPSCLNNLTAMVEGESSREVSSHYYFERFNNGISRIFYVGKYHDYAMVEWQGREMEFEENLGLLKIIDLSSNQLTGEVPDSITSLRGLVVLDLSRNKLHGNIPLEIGQMKLLLSLNFSGNSFSGHLPMGLSMLTSLNSLDLSHNNFSGRIPTGTQLQSFSASCYAGNAGLCGAPLTQRCLGDELPVPTISVTDVAHDSEDDNKWLYIGMASGFITGFWGICGFLLLNRTGRHSFFRFFDNLKDSFYVQLAIRLPNRRV